MMGVAFCQKPPSVTMTSDPLMAARAGGFLSIRDIPR